MADDSDIPTITIDDCVKGIERMIKDNYKIFGLQASGLKRLAQQDPDAATVSYILNFYYEGEINLYTIEIINPDKKGREMIKVKFLHSVNGNPQNLIAREQMINSGYGAYRYLETVKGDIIPLPIPDDLFIPDSVKEEYCVEFTVLDYNAYLLVSQPGINPKASEPGNALAGSHADAEAAKIAQGHSIDEILAELKKRYGLENMQKDTKNNNGYSYEIEPVHESSAEIRQKTLLTIKLDDEAVETYLILCNHAEIGVICEGKKIDGGLPLDKKNDLLWKSYSAAKYLEEISGNRCHDRLAERIERTPDNRVQIDSIISKHAYTNIPRSNVLTTN